MSVATRLRRRKVQWLPIPGAPYEISEDGKNVRRKGTYDCLKFKEDKPVVTLYFGTKSSEKKFPLQVLFNHALSGMPLNTEKHGLRTPTGGQLKRNAWNVRPWQKPSGTWEIHVLTMIEGPQAHQLRTGHEFEGIIASSAAWLGIDAPLIEARA